MGVRVKDFKALRIQENNAFQLGSSGQKVFGQERAFAYSLSRAEKFLAAPQQVSGRPPKTGRATSAPVR